MWLLFVNTTSAATDYHLPSGEALSDPTMPHGWQPRKKSSAKARHFKLNYILNASTRKQAMVNGQKVTEGDSVSGAKVLRIQEGAVTLLVNGQHRTLRMNKYRGIKQAK